MMYNTYSSCSSIISLRTAVGFTDYSCYSNNNNYANERCPSSYYCSCCCSFPVNCRKLLLPMYVNPSFLYGLRQSTLIHCPPSRRLIVGSNDRLLSSGRCCSFGGGGGCCCVKQESVLEKCCSEKCCDGERKIGRGLGSGCKEKCCAEKRRNVGVERGLISGCKERCCVEKRKSVVDVDRIRGSVSRSMVTRRDFRCNALGDAEAILSLLSEESVEECVPVRDWKRSSVKEAKVVREQNLVSGKVKDRKENGSSGVGYVESESKKQEVGLGKVHYGEEGHKRREEREDLLIEEDRRSRRKESSSSYYSFSDSGDFESDTEVDVKQERFGGESSTGQVKDSRKSGVVIQETKQDSELYRDEKDQQLISSTHNIRLGSSTDWDRRKKTEKKLSEDSTETSKSRKDSIVRQSKLSQAKESNSMVTSSSEKQFSHTESGSASNANSHRQSRSNIKRDNYSSELSKSSGRQDQSTSDVSFHGHSISHIKKDNRVSEFSVSQRQEEQSTSGVSLHRQLGSQTKIDNEEIEYSKSSRRHEQSIDRHNVETTSTTLRTSVQGQEDAMVVGQSVQETGCDYCRACGRSTEEKKVKSDNQQRLELSEIHGDPRWITAMQSQSETRHGKQGVGSTSLLTSVEEARQQQQTAHGGYGYIQSTSGSQQQSESRIKNVAEMSTLVYSEQDVLGLREEMSGKTVKRTEPHKSFQSGASASKVRITSEKIDSHSAYDEREYNEQSGESASKVRITSEEIISHSASDKRVHNEQTGVSASKVRITSEGVDSHSASDERVYTEQTGASASKVQITSEEIDDRSASDKRVYNEQTGASASKVRITSEEIDGRSASDKRVYNEQTGASASKVRITSEEIDGRSASDKRVCNMQTGASASKVQITSEEIDGRSASDKRVYNEQTGASASKVRITSEEIDSHSTFDKRVYNEQTSSTSKAKSVEELVEKRKHIDETIVQTRLLNEMPSPFYQAALSGNFSGEAHASQPSATLIPQPGVKQIREEEVQSGSLLSRTSPLHRYTEGRPLDVEPSSIFVRKDSGRIKEVGSSDAYAKPHSTTVPASHVEDDIEIQSYEGSSPIDAIGSAERMQESSGQIVDDFLEKMRDDTSTSDTRIKKSLSLADSEHQDEEYKQKGPSQSDSEKANVRKQDSSPSSGGSLTKGESDEMWDVKDHFVQEGSEPESVDAATTERLVAKRTGKSLWSSVAGVFRLRRGSEKQKSPAKASQRDSPNESATSETFFTPNGQNDGNDANMERDQIRMPEGPISSDQSIPRITTSRSQNEGFQRTELVNLSHEPTSSDNLLMRKSTTRNQEEDPRVTISDDKFRRGEVNVSVSPSASHVGSLSGFISIGTNIDSNLTHMSSVSTPTDVLVPSARRLSRSDAIAEIEEAGTSVSIPVDVSAPSARRLRRSEALEEVEEAGHNEGFVSSTSEQRDNSLDSRESVSPASEISEAEVKRRKLQRSKQVLQERFDEWEDAYRRDDEQRKVDEIFMREALAEAIKAADSWEVPVGAVLVQNGKVLARGYNLVEELRDSTAHAEMICIREASNNLKTWRLSGTTLYVTLEPCPMCAGAILQARIGTLVWGAPNKLLGADGSWIRLFPEGPEGDQRSEVAEKPAAPQHPFHPKMNIRRGVLDSECAQVMQQFFQLRRKKMNYKEKKSEEPEQSSRLSVRIHPTKLLHKMHGAFHFCL